MWFCDCVVYAFVLHFFSFWYDVIENGNHKNTPSPCHHIGLCYIEIDACRRYDTLSTTSQIDISFSLFQTVKNYLISLSEKAFLCKLLIEQKNYA